MQRKGKQGTKTKEGTKAIEVELHDQDLERTQQRERDNSIDYRVAAVGDAEAKASWGLNEGVQISDNEYFSDKSSSERQRVVHVEGSSSDDESSSTSDSEASDDSGNESDDENILSNVSEDGLQEDMISKKLREFNSEIISILTYGEGLLLIGTISENEINEYNKLNRKLNIQWALQIKKITNLFTSNGEVKNQEGLNNALVKLNKQQLDQFQRAKETHSNIIHNSQNLAGGTKPEPFEFKPASNDEVSQFLEQYQHDQSDSEDSDSDWVEVGENGATPRGHLNMSNSDFNAFDEAFGLSSSKLTPNFSAGLASKPEQSGGVVVPASGVDGQPSEFHARKDGDHFATGLPGDISTARAREVDGYASQQLEIGVPSENGLPLSSEPSPLPASASPAAQLPNAVRPITQNEQERLNSLAADLNNALIEFESGATDLSTQEELYNLYITYEYIKKFQVTLKESWTKEHVGQNALEQLDTLFENNSRAFAATFETLTATKLKDEEKTELGRLQSEFTTFLAQFLNQGTGMRTPAFNIYSAAQFIQLQNMHEASTISTDNNATPKAKEELAALAIRHEADFNAAKLEIMKGKISETELEALSFIQESFQSFLAGFNNTSSRYKYEKKFLLFYEEKLKELEDSHSTAISLDTINSVEGKAALNFLIETQKREFRAAGESHKKKMITQTDEAHLQFFRDNFNNNILRQFNKDSEIYITKEDFTSPYDQTLASMRSNHQSIKAKWQNGNLGIHAINELEYEHKLREESLNKIFKELNAKKISQAELEDAVRSFDTILNSCETEAANVNDQNGLNSLFKSKLEQLKAVHDDKKAAWADKDKAANSKLDDLLNDNNRLLHNKFQQIYGSKFPGELVPPPAASPTPTPAAAAAPPHGSAAHGTPGTTPGTPAPVSPMPATPVASTPAAPAGSGAAVPGAASLGTYEEPPSRRPKLDSSNYQVYATTSGSPAQIPLYGRILRESAYDSATRAKTALKDALIRVKKVQKDLDILEMTLRNFTAEAINEFKAEIDNAKYLLDSLQQSSLNGAKKRKWFKKDLVYELSGPDNSLILELQAAIANAENSLEYARAKKSTNMEDANVGIEVQLSHVRFGERTFVDLKDGSDNLIPEDVNGHAYKNANLQHTRKALEATLSGTSNSASSVAIALGAPPPQPQTKDFIYKSVTTKEDRVFKPVIIDVGHNTGIPNAPQLPKIGVLNARIADPENNGKFVAYSEVHNATTKKLSENNNGFLKSRKHVHYADLMSAALETYYRHMVIESDEEKSKPFKIFVSDTDPAANAEMVRMLSAIAMIHGRNVEVKNFKGHEVTKLPNLQGTPTKVQLDRDDLGRLKILYEERFHAQPGDSTATAQNKANEAYAKDVEYRQAGENLQTATAKKRKRESEELEDTSRKFTRYNGPSR